MKKLKVAALVLAIGMMFTSCAGKDDDKTNSSNSSNGGVVSDLISGGEEVVSDIESGVESMMPGDDNSDRSEENSKVASNDASNDASLDTPTIAQKDVSKIDYTSLSKLDGTKRGWGQGKITDENNIPVSCIDFQEKYGKYNSFFVEKEDKKVYLTFDEGYENGYTEKILDVLKEKKCPAVFFVTAPYVKENASLIQRMIDEGHAVGNHTVNHPSMPSVSLEKAANEIAELHNYVEDTFQYEMTLFRPPMGEFSEQTLALTQELGYKSIFWSFAYQDWETENQPEKEKALQKITSSVHDGAIYLLHAVSSTNTEILGEAIDQIRAEGYEFKLIE